MAARSARPLARGRRSRLACGAFALERYPFACRRDRAALDAIGDNGPSTAERPSTRLRPRLERGAATRMGERRAPTDLPEPTPGVSSATRWSAAVDELVDACDGFLRRAAIARVADRRRAPRDPARHGAHARHRQPPEDVLHRAAKSATATPPFQGKGFRSLGQEAIYAAAIRLRRGDALSRRRRRLARRRRRAADPRPRRRRSRCGPSRRRCAWCCSAQMGKAGPPMDGKDLHVGDFAWGILPPAAPLAIGDADDGRHGDGVRARAAAGASRVSFIGEGGIVARRVARGDQPLRRAPAAGDLLRRRTTRPRCRRRSREQSAVRVFADKAAGYGIPGITIDGTDPDAIAAAFAWAAERARGGHGPDADRARRDAHVRPRASRRHAVPRQGSAAVVGRIRRSPSRATPIASCYEYWAARDPIPTYAARLEADGVIERRRSRAHSSARPRRSSRRGARGHRRAVAGRRSDAGVGVLAGRAAARAHRGARSGGRAPRVDYDPALPPLEAGAAVRSRRAARSSKRVMLGVGDALRADPRVFVYGEDVGGKYGNAFLLLRPLLEGVRRSHHQLAARRRRGARRLRRRGARRPAADRRDAVQRLRRDRLQSARQQRREDPLPLGRRRCRWSCACRGAACATPARITSQNTEAVVLPHAGPEDRRAVDAARRARADGGGGRRSRSGALLRAHRALSRSAHQAGARPTRRRRRCRSARPRCAAPATTSRSSRTAPTSTSRCASPRRSPRTASRRACSICASLAPLDRDGGPRRRAPLQPRADRPRGHAHRRHRREPRRDHPGRGVRVARRAGPHHRRARHAGAVLAAARGVLPAERGARSSAPRGCWLAY